MVQVSWREGLVGVGLGLGAALEAGGLLHPLSAPTPPLLWTAVYLRLGLVVGLVVGPVVVVVVVAVVPLDADCPFGPVSPSPPSSLGSSCGLASIES